MATIYGTNFNDNGTTQNGVYYSSLYGTASNDSIYGLNGNDVLSGGGGNDTLNGGTGNDTMYGGTGNDTYYVDSYSDVVTEYANQGTDTVYSSVSYSLGANVENVTLTGTAYSAYGNALNNVINGNSSSNYLSGGAGNDTIYGGGGNDTLNGGTGNDTMYGGTGNDTYYVDSYSDVVTEYANQGTDTVYSSISYSLGANVENVTLTGTAYSAYGNALNNVINGNSSSNYLSGGAGNDTIYGGGGNDTLNGGTGNDTMYGGTGNDVYYVDSYSDVVTEYANQGTDTVYSSVSYSLGANVENVTLTGTAYYAYGNALNNVINGNSSSNYLSGGSGNDTLYGGAGNDTLVGGYGVDTLYGGAGADKFVFNNKYEGIDIIKDFQWTEGDKIQISKISFGASSNGQFSYDGSNGALSFLGYQFATIENKPAGFSTNLDIVLV